MSVLVRSMSDQCQINVKDKKTLQWVKKYAIVILLPL